MHWYPKWIVLATLFAILEGNLCRVHCASIRKDSPSSRVNLNMSMMTKIVNSSYFLL